MEVRKERRSVARRGAQKNNEMLDGSWWLHHSLQLSLTFRALRYAVPRKELDSVMKQLAAAESPAK
jgi:hypothetical protein